MDLGFVRPEAFTALKTLDKKKMNTKFRMKTEDTKANKKRNHNK
jgi:hypothetical protein